LRHFASPERPLVRLYTDVLATDIELYTDILATDIGHRAASGGALVRLYADILATDIYKQPIHR
jgi:hypothetical protein